MKDVPELYEHQKEALKFIEDKNCFALFMEQGTGKSKVIVEKSLDLYVKGLINCVIVISPNAVKEQWIKEQFKEHYPYTDWIDHLWSGGKTLKETNSFKSGVLSKNKLFVFSCNVEAFQSNSIDKFISTLLNNRKVFVVIDESTRIKNGRRKPVKGKRGGAKRTNKIIDFFEKVPYKAILTGTPTPKSPFDLWSQFEFLQKDFFGMDYFYFTHRYGIMTKHSTDTNKTYYRTMDEKTYSIVKSQLNRSVKEKGKLTPQIIDKVAIRNGLSTKDVIVISKMDKFACFKNLDELKKKVNSITFFVKKESCLDLPDKVYEKLYCELKGEQKRLYKQLKENMYTEYCGEELTVTSKVIMYLRLQMITGGLFPYVNTEIKLDPNGEEFFGSWFEYSVIKDNAKLKTLMDDLEEVSLETSIVVWAKFRGEIDLIYDALTNAGYLCEKYYGGSSIEAINKFKRKEVQILIGNPLKGGEGLNLQISTLHYFYSNLFKADSRLQAEDRSHRIGQYNKVTYKDIVCKNTVDVRILEVLKRREDLINYFRSRDLQDILE